MNLIELDGSRGQGDGRSCERPWPCRRPLAKSWHSKCIRAKRPKPGLMRQHLTCVQRAGRIGRVRGGRARVADSGLSARPGARGHALKWGHGGESYCRCRACFRAQRCIARRRNTQPDGAAFTLPKSQLQSSIQNATRGFGSTRHDFTAGARGRALRRAAWWRLRTRTRLGGYRATITRCCSHRCTDRSFDALLKRTLMPGRPVRCASGCGRTRRSGSCWRERRRARSGGGRRRKREKSRV
jgi:RNA 3'-terminal phosphate cyclase